MVQHYPSNDANKQRDATPARKLRQDAKPTGVFRCDRCDRVVPEALLVVQDGYSLCRTLCADETSITEFNILYAKQLAETDSYEPNIDPPTSAFDGAVSITSHTAFPVHITAQNTPVVVSFTGVGFTSDIAISYSNVLIADDTAPVITSTTIALSIEVTDTLADGYYNITIAGSTYWGAIQVTGCGLEASP